MFNMKKIIVMSLLTLIINACAATLDSKGSEVRIITGSTKDCCCKSLGLVNESAGMYWTKKGSTRDAYTKLQNEVGRMGGNAIYLLQSDFGEFSGTYIQAEALVCNFSKINNET